MRNVSGHGKRLSYYDFGHTTVYASRFDQRFPYCAYVPTTMTRTATRPIRWR